ncbi:MAG: protein kinase [Deltaproteobacteria bacterium]|nr:protein kinase [Deltaproteobacteria bacterium]
MIKPTVQALLEGTSYRLLDELGAGAMGEVYTAEHLRLKRPVVVKILKPHLGSGMTDRLRLEAQALASVRHDNVVDVLDVDATTDGRPFLVMERLEGQPLDVYLAARGGWLPVEEAIELARQTLSGLHVVHEAGFVHRDIKPPNLFRCSSGRIKLLDFGVIKLMTEVTDVEPLSVPTADGIVVGTPKYMAPEQALGKTIDRRTDVYATGIVLYAMLTGKTPFDHHRDLTQMLYAHVNEAPKPPSEVAAQAVSATLDEVVLRALAKQAEDRFDTALAFASELLQQAPAFQRLAVELSLDEVALGQSGPIFGRQTSPGPGPVAGGSVAVTGPSGGVEATVASPPPQVVAEPTVASPAPPTATDQTEIAPALASRAAVTGAGVGQPEAPAVPAAVPPWRDPLGWQLFVLCAALSAAATTLVVWLGGG